VSASGVSDGHDSRERAKDRLARNSFLSSHSERHLCAKNPSADIEDSRRVDPLNGNRSPMNTIRAQQRKRRHSERRLCAKNLSCDFGFDHEGSFARKTSDGESSFALFRTTTARLFQQTASPLHSGFSL